MFNPAKLLSHVLGVLSLVPIAEIDAALAAKLDSLRGPAISDPRFVQAMPQTEARDPFMKFHQCYVDDEPCASPVVPPVHDPRTQSPLSSLSRQYLVCFESPKSDVVPPAHDPRTQSPLSSLSKQDFLCFEAPDEAVVPLAHDPRTQSPLSSLSRQDFVCFEPPDPELVAVDATHDSDDFTPYQTAGSFIAWDYFTCLYPSALADTTVLPPPIDGGSIQGTSVLVLEVTEPAWSVPPVSADLSNATQVSAPINDELCGSLFYDVVNILTCLLAFGLLFMDVEASRLNGFDFGFTHWIAFVFVIFARNFAVHEAHDPDSIFGVTEPVNVDRLNVKAPSSLSANAEDNIESWGNALASDTSSLSSLESGSTSTTSTESSMVLDSAANASDVEVAANEGKTVNGAIEASAARNVNTAGDEEDLLAAFGDTDNNLLVTSVAGPRYQSNASLYLVTNVQIYYFLLARMHHLRAGRALVDTPTEPHIRREAVAAVLPTATDASELPAASDSTTAVESDLSAPIEGTSRTGRRKTRRGTKHRGWGGKGKPGTRTSSSSSPSDSTKVSSNSDAANATPFVPSVGASATPSTANAGRAHGTRSKKQTL